MIDFPVRSPDDAPAGSRDLLAAAAARFGFVPNLLGVLAEAPAALRGYLDLAAAVESCSLTPAEQQLVLLAVSFEHECDYCMAAHSTLARKARVPADIRAALREGRAVPDPRLESLRRVARALVVHRGRVPPEDLEGFLAAGFSRAQLLEVVTAVAQKTLSNYVNHLAHTPLDPPFAADRWKRPTVAGAG